MKPMEIDLCAGCAALLSTAYHLEKHHYANERRTTCGHCGDKKPCYPYTMTKNERRARG